MIKKHIGIKKGKLYISKQLGFVCILVFLAVAFGLFTYFKSSTELGKSERPLGVAPSGASEIPKDSEAAAEFMIQKIKEEHKNKMVVIFYYDSYELQKEAVKHANYLIEVLNNKAPYKDLKDIITYKILTSGQICEVQEEELVCEPRHLDALKKLGIEHIKIVILYPDDFNPAVDLVFGADSIIAIPTKKKSSESDAQLKLRLQNTFDAYLKKSLGADEMTGNRDEYLKAVLSCFYGSKESYKIDLLKFKNCKEFRAKYPDFWKHDVN